LLLLIIGFIRLVGGSVSYLTGANVAGTPGKRFFNSISCDQLAARHLGQNTRFPSLSLSAIEPDGGQNSGHGSGLSLSWDDSGNPIPGVNRPLELHRTIFANPTDTREQLDARLRKKQSILDIVRVGVGEMKRALSKRDLQKLDEYFTGVRQIEQGLERQARWADNPNHGPGRAPRKTPNPTKAGE
jgi:hypothetical protein